MKGPCYECEDRAPGCHSGCDRYKAWKEELKAVKDEKQAAKAIDASVMGVKMHGMKRVKKRLWER